MSISCVLSPFLLHSPSLLPKFSGLMPCLPLYISHFFTLKISNHFKAANRPLFLDELKQRITDLNYVKGKLHRVA